MERKRWLATVAAYLTLEVGALLGVPIRADQIEEMTRLLNQTQVTQIQHEDAGGEPPAPEG